MNPDPLQLIETGAWHAEPVRAAHHRRVGFVVGLLAGILVTLILTGAGRVAASSAARVAIPASSFRAVEADPQESRTRREQPKPPSTILDPFPVSPPPERAAVEVPAAELVVRELAKSSKTFRAATGSSVAAARSYALSALGAAQFACLSELIERESGWNPYARNRKSGAYGLGQALPASKMAPYGSNYLTNAVTQIRWMIAYVGKYGGPCGAWAFWQAKRWY